MVKATKETELSPALFPDGFLMADACLGRAKWQGGRYDAEYDAQFYVAMRVYNYEVA